MFYPPSSLLLLLHEPPTTRPVYDNNQPLIVYTPRLPRLRALAARLTRTRPTAAGHPTHGTATQHAGDCEEVPVTW